MYLPLVIGALNLISGIITTIGQFLRVSELNEANRNASIFLGLFDTNKSVIADVYTLFKGKMDIMKIDEGSESATITLNVESRLIAFDRPRDRRFTHEDQINRFSGDLGFEFVPDLQDKEIIWGKKGS